MLGAYHISIHNSVVKYEFDIKRNITVIKGDSATGKTVLVEMIQDYIMNGSDSGVFISCKVPCRVIGGNTWEEQLAPIRDSIVFIDEGNSFVTSYAFASKVKEGHNYYVLVTRERLNNLPYSVTEIYGIKSSGKYESLEPVYHEFYRIYDNRLTSNPPIKPSLIIMEDSNAGYEFFSEAVKETDIDCTSAGGKANIFNLLMEVSDGTVLVIADGAAFGSEIERV